MGIPDDEILDVVPLSVIPYEAIELNQPIDASASACSDQGNSSCIPSGSTPTTNSKEDIHHTDRVIRNLVTRILNEGHSVKGVSTPLSQMYPSPEVEQHSGKDDDSSSSEKDLAAEGLCSLGKTMSEKGKFVASKTANASHSEKHDVIDLKDGSSDDQKESLLHQLKPSVAKRMKTRKGRYVAELMSARKSKKTAGIGPSKSWSKVEVKKRKWKFVIQRRVVVKRELGKDAADVKEVMDLIKVAGLLKTVAGLSQCYEGLVKEFIINILEDIADKNIKEFCKVFVRGRKIEGAGELEVTDNKVCREIIDRQVKGWPIKKHLPAGKLTIKYAILHKIGATNWIPTNHISTIANTLGRFTFVVGTKVKFDYGRFMFEQIIKHASTNVVKLPIAFPSMICGIILNQHPGILCSNDLPNRRKPFLSMHYKLLEGSHVEDIIMTSTMKKPSSKSGTVAELKETCKELGEGIRVATARKQSLEALIASLEQTESENIENDNVSHEEEVEAHTSSERYANHDDTSENSDSGADEAASSSSTE
ncbi:uncharacterized protein LOC127129524 [Lathyrus oleraceus]|uniref:uncharacterized protein LOC127129524 n=1 Tax=Pisum sativum TaxID=3888 RepID=UPI0021CE013F|nr:uncharacterized protein LOC127129524 [Pisum sativum]